MIAVKDEGIILEKTNLEFENKAVLNPACVERDGITHMFYRAISLNDISTIGYCQLKNNQVIKRLTTPIIVPEYDYEKKGVEDPRITFLEGTYYLIYTAHDGENALIAYATSTDLINFTKQGILSPKISYDKAEDFFNESKLEEKYTMFETLYEEREGRDLMLFEKDASLFPKKINHKFALFHRVLPGIQVIYFDKFSDLTEEFWRNYLKDLSNHIVLDPLYWYESRNIGGGCPPIETPEGWLIIYHTVEDNSSGSIYRASAALLDLNDPRKVIGRLQDPLFSPEAAWEKNGLVNNVVFPTGAIIKNERLYIYHGAADRLIACKSVLIYDLLTELKKCPIDNE